MGMLQQPFCTLLTFKQQGAGGLVSQLCKQGKLKEALSAYGRKPDVGGAI